MRILKTILSSPYILSLIPFFILIIVFPLKLNKYILETKSSVIVPKDYFTWYYDLDNDGSSESISAFNETNTTEITIHNEFGIIDQWNFKGNFDFSLKKCLFITGDQDNNGVQELYVFTLNNDTILLHCISDFENPILTIKNRVIAITGNGIKTPDPFIIPAEMDDLDLDGSKELIFGIGSGFSLYPRNVFAYYISKDSLVKSPESSYFIQGILQADITDDGKKEIIPYGYATANVKPEKARYHDYSSYLMILDNNLKFLFNPIEFKGRYTALTPAIWKNNDDTCITWLYKPSLEKSSSTFFFVNNSGIIIDSVPLNFFAFNCLNTLRKNSDVLLPVGLKNGIGFLNNNFELLKTLPDWKSYSVFQQDFDLDGKTEILLLNHDKNKLFIYREDLTDPVSTNIALAKISDDLVSVKTGKSQPEIFIQSGQNQYVFQYRLNPAYPYYYLYFLGIYLSVLAFALMIRNLQKNQLRRKYETEKKISELQLALIRNQLDPHFTLNVINSIIYSVEFHENVQAGEQLRQFANLYRNMLLSAGSTRRTLAEELDFCDNYLLLEKMRFKERFNYKISVAEDIDKNYLIPKLLIQIHTENALKHGLESLKSGGVLLIEINNVDGVILIEISDNGIGREKAKSQAKQSTGKGLEIMNELYSIYNKYYNEEVSSQIKDLYDINGNPCGTKVCISIKPNGKS